MIQSIRRFSWVMAGRKEGRKEGMYMYLDFLGSAHYILQYEGFYHVPSVHRLYRLKLHGMCTGGYHRELLFALRAHPTKIALTQDASVYMYLSTYYFYLRSFDRFHFIGLQPDPSSTLRLIPPFQILLNVIRASHSSTIESQS